MAEVRHRTSRDKFIDKRRELYAKIDILLEQWHESGKTGQITIIFNLTQGQLAKGAKVGFDELIG